MISFTVPGKPLGKGRPRFSRSSGRVYTPAATESYEGKVAFFAREAMNGHAMFEAGTALQVSVVAWFEVPASWTKRKRADALEGRLVHTGRPDADNILKILGDACNGVLWHDDSAIADARIVKRYGQTAGISVAVEAL